MLGLDDDEKEERCIKLNKDFPKKKMKDFLA
jgi:hypothetical protein